MQLLLSGTVVPSHSSISKKEGIIANVLETRNVDPFMSDYSTHSVNTEMAPTKTKLSV